MSWKAVTDNIWGVVMICCAIAAVHGLVTNFTTREAPKAAPQNVAVSGAGIVSRELAVASLYAHRDKEYAHAKLGDVVYFEASTGRFCVEITSQDGLALGNFLLTCGLWKLESKAANDISTLATEPQ